jgi:hypothetical protein
MRRGPRLAVFPAQVPNPGTLRIDISRGEGLLDLSPADSQGSKWWHPVLASVKAGTTYEITLWYVKPGVEFEFRTSLQQL